MPNYPMLKPIPLVRREVSAFYGYRRCLRPGDGRFYDTENLSSRLFPLLTCREKRGTLARLSAPAALLGKEKLMYLSGGQLFYNGLNVTYYLSAKGLSISANLTPKILVSMGAYAIIYPDKLFINTEDFTDCGRIEAYFSTGENESVSFTPCDGSGKPLPAPTVAASAPTMPENGALWLDSSAESGRLLQYSQSNGGWTELPAVFTRIDYPGIGTDFAAGDGVSLSGCGIDGAEEISALNGCVILAARGDDFVVIPGLTGQSRVQSSGCVTLWRKMPAMDFIIQAENRLWGCKYGMVDGRPVNEIYACALGDFKNWNQFSGLSTDSYAASVGSGGVWTGAVNFLGYPLFFKENSLHKIYISPSGAHRIVESAVRGVQQGCGGSLAVADETLYYKSAAGVCAYDGSLPRNVSDALGDKSYSAAVAGACGQRYYISMLGQDGYSLFVYDSRLGIWHREDATHALAFAACGEKLYYIDADSLVLKEVRAESGEAEGELDWRAESGIIGWEESGGKYLARVELRMALDFGAAAELFVEYDSEGVWHRVLSASGGGTGSFTLPICPRRCDHFRLKLAGRGGMRLCSVARFYSRGRG